MVMMMMLLNVHDHGAVCQDSLSWRHDVARASPEERPALRWKEVAVSRTCFSQTCTYRRVCALRPPPCCHRAAFFSILAV